jgi:hypothetical protein
MKTRPAPAADDSAEPKAMNTAAKPQRQVEWLIAWSDQLRIATRTRANSETRIPEIRINSE